MCRHPIEPACIPRVLGGDKPELSLPTMQAKELKVVGAKVIATCGCRSSFAGSLVEPGSIRPFETLRWPILR